MLIAKAFAQVNPEYKDLSPTIRKVDVIETFEARAEWRLREVIQSRKANGLRTNWDLMTPKKVIDEVCSLDIIICPGGNTNYLLGFDVTLDGTKIAEKISKKTDLLGSKAYAELKIAKVGIIHLESRYGVELSEQDLDWDLHSSAERESLVFAIENFMYDVHEEDSKVLSTTIKI